MPNDTNAAMREALNKLSGLIALMEDISIEIGLKDRHRESLWRVGVQKLKEGGAYLDEQRRSWILEDSTNSNGVIILKPEVTANGNG